MHKHQPYIHVEEIPTNQKERFIGVFALRLRSCPVEREVEGNRHTIEEQRLLDMMDVINSLFCLDPPRTIALRYLSSPDPRSFVAGSIDIVMLTQFIATSAETATYNVSVFAPELLEMLTGRFPDHSWEMVEDAENFQRFWTPFDWKTVHVAEIRRREDFIKVDTMRPRPGLGRSRQTNSQTVIRRSDYVYFVHRFIPRPGDLNRLLRLMLLHPAPLIWQISLSPVTLTREEETALMAEIAKCERRAQKWTSSDNSLSQSEPTLHQSRARDMAENLFQQLMRLKDAPFLLSIYFASPAPIPYGLLETTGTEITAPVGNLPHPTLVTHTHFLQMGGYDVLFPEDQRQKRIASNNMRYLQWQPWGATVAPPKLQRTRFLVDALEAASAFRLPLARAEGLPGLFTTGVRHRPLPREIALLGTKSKTEGLKIGVNQYMGFSHPVSLNEKDRRQHLYVVGQTGTGKTTLLKSMILSDIEAGQGLAVIDPHGDLFDELLGYIPPHRMEDVVILDPTDMEYPVGLNILECQQQEERYFVVREFKAIMEKLLVDQYGLSGKEFSGPIFWQHTQMNLLLTMSHPEQPGTLLEFYEIFHHKEYWKKWIPPVWTDSKLNVWVNEVLPRINYIYRSHSTDSTLGEYISSKFEDFVFDPKLRLIFGQRRSTINLSKVMDEGKILLVNLAKGELTEANAQFLGMLLMAKIQAAAMQRSNIPAHKRKVFYVYVDEFQSVATQNFVLLLSEARKFGVGLILANQFISQINDARIVQSIFGNVGTLVSFRVGQADAKHFLEPQFYPYFTRQDLTNLPNWHACVKTTVHGQVVAPFSMHTVVPDQEWHADIAEQVRQFSRRRYGRPRDIVEKEIEESLKYDAGE
ncbi:MAG: DUF87 domain-containing protein [Calditrichaeota bacterium]|nr:MAG: DUF87 domain-containing protein [Calditrichota bacterium]